MHKLVWSLVSALAVFAVAKVADAHSFICEKKVNGQSMIEVSTFPTTLTFDFKVINNHPYADSTYTGVSDPSFPEFSFEPAAPYTVLYSSPTVSDSYQITLNSIEDCMALAARDGTADSMLINTFTVSWEGGGSATCSAKVTCVAPPPPPPPPPSEVTRTPGFYKTHVSALTQCLAEGAIDLGFTSIDSVEEALGLLWGVPSKYVGSGISRSEIDKARFILGRHTLVGICNNRLFGSVPEPSDLLTDAVEALAGTDCKLMMQLAGMIDDFNNSGDDEPFPMDFEPGKATPRYAWSIAVDPTSPSTDVCGG